MKLKSIRNIIYSLPELVEQVGIWKAAGEKIVFTNGVFDLLHLGHISYLSDASDLGTKFIIGLNADASVKTLAKGPARPIKDQESRATILAAMGFVDAVVIFDDSTPSHLIDSLIPNVLVKGGDYNPNEGNPENKKYIVGREVVLENGGQVEVIPFIEGYSTTALEKKIIDLNTK